MDENKMKLPLGIIRQAVMKLDSFIIDIKEILEDDDLDDDDRELFEKISETAGIMGAEIINIVRREMDEEEFLNENPEMDPIDAFPGTEEVEDLLNEEIE